MTEVDETTMVGTLLKEVLSSPAEWDPQGQFNIGEVCCFIADQYDECLYEIAPETQLKTVLSWDGVQIKQGLPVLQIYRIEKKQASFMRIDSNRYIVA